MSMKSRLFPRSALLFFLFEHIYNGPGTDFADETAEAIHHMNIYEYIFLDALAWSEHQTVTPWLCASV